MSEAYKKFVKDITSKSNYTREATFTDPKSFVTDKQTTENLEFSNKVELGRRYVFTLCPGGEVRVVSNLKITLEIFAEMDMTIEDFLQFNPFMRLDLNVGSTELIHLSKDWMLLDNFVNQHLYSLTRLEDNKYLFTIDFNVLCLTGALLVSGYNQMNLYLEMSIEQAAYKLGKLSADITSEKYANSHAFTDNIEKSLIFPMKILSYPGNDPVHDSETCTYKLDFNGTTGLIYYTILSHDGKFLDDDIIESMSLQINGINVGEMPMSKSLELLEKEANRTITRKNTGILDLRAVYDNLNKMNPCVRGDLESGINCSKIDMLRASFKLNDKREKYKDIYIGFMSVINASIEFNDRHGKYYGYKNWNM